MNYDDKTYQLIERYLEGDLSPEEVKAFDDRMEQEPEFREAVELEMDVHGAIQQVGRTSMKDRLRAIDQELQEADDDDQENGPTLDTGENNTAKRRRIRWLPLAASIILLLAPISLFLLYGGDSPEDIVAEALSAAPLPTGLRAVEDSLFKEAINAYKDEEYAKADTLMLAFEKVADQNEAWAFHGLVKLQQDQPEKGEEYLLRYADQALQAEDRYWLLSISLFMQGKKPEARSALEKVIATDPDHKEDAQTLLESLSD